MSLTYGVNVRFYILGAVPPAGGRVSRQPY